jgi:CRP-like cAMP-binding protein
MRRRLIRKGEIIYAEGQVHTALWQVMSGTVRVTNQNPDGKEVVFAIFSSGDCFGEISLLDGLAAANTATAMDQVELAELAKPDFDELYDQYPAFAHQLMRLMCGRVRHMLNFYADVTLRPLEQRMASRILYISGAQHSPSGSLELQCTQQDLAAMVGATRQAVSKVLNRWREQKIISLEYSRITVLLPDRLGDIAAIAQ